MHFKLGQTQQNNIFSLFILKLPQYSDFIIFNQLLHSKHGKNVNWPSWIGSALWLVPGVVLIPLQIGIWKHYKALTKEWKIFENPSTFVEGTC